MIQDSIEKSIWIPIRDSPHILNSSGDDDSEAGAESLRDGERDKLSPHLTIGTLAVTCDVGSSDEKSRV